MLTFTYRNIDGRVPTPGEFDSHDQAVIDMAKNTINTMDGLLYKCHFREAPRAAMSLAQETNRYLDKKAPWKTIKQDKPASATALYVAITVLAALSTALYPFLPFSSQKLREFLGFEGTVENGGWQLHSPPPGQRLLPPHPLFTKLDEKLAEEETNRLGQVYD